MLDNKQQQQYDCFSHIVYIIIEVQLLEAEGLEHSDMLLEVGLIWLLSILR